MTGTASGVSLFNYAGNANGLGTTGPLTLLDAVLTGTASIPTHSEWVMIVLVGLVGLLGFRETHRRKGLPL